MMDFKDLSLLEHCHDRVGIKIIFLALWETRKENKRLADRTSLVYERVIIDIKTIILWINA